MRRARPALAEALPCCCCCCWKEARACLKWPGGCGCSKRVGRAPLLLCSTVEESEHNRLLGTILRLSAHRIQLKEEHLEVDRPFRLRALPQHETMADSNGPVVGSGVSSRPGQLWEIRRHCETATTTHTQPSAPTTCSTCLESLSSGVSPSSTSNGTSRSVWRLKRSCSRLGLAGVASLIVVLPSPSADLRTMSRLAWRALRTGAKLLSPASTEVVWGCTSSARRQYRSRSRSRSAPRTDDEKRCDVSVDTSVVAGTTAMDEHTIRRRCCCCCERDMEVADDDEAPDGNVPAPRLAPEEPVVAAAVVAAIVEAVEAKLLARSGKKKLRRGGPFALGPPDTSAEKS
ncbi:hypothetical protein FA10DRAFT_9517 [Acaromyces ingoldii]|uniref:Uncharacterized protein n=1 Tax=Acaromyces ingoldii TaxID=215250 RepID=A0A316YXV7_9BASI|nr:hypothetical protein FA10DRAFT_9517 [Acaromyces ingoldii]PWN92913.1 hypothetical protein FA10DRAFT_9517 [Acaromyces ingoldii]